MNNKDYNDMEFYKVFSKDVDGIIKYYFGVDIAKEIKEVKQEPIKEILSVDMLLDQYNDYMILYKMFGDDEYKIKAESTMSELKNFN